MGHQSVGWPGFSPGPLSVSMSPAPDQPSSFEFSTSRAGAGIGDEPGSPLVFMRTPGATVQDTTCPDSSKRFSSWMESTSPYAGRKTPPTASMKSLAAGDENTPPGHDMARGLSDKQGGSFGSQQHFQSWLRATHSTSWTPRKSPAAATPPPAPAPSPAATPMSIMRDLQHSATTPPSWVQAQGPVKARAAAVAAADDFDTSEEEDDDGGEASTTVGAAQLAAAADRAAATSRIAGQRAQQHHQQQQLSTPPRVPASSPVIPGPAVLGLQQQQQASLLQAAADRMAQDSLATPMSQLSISRRPGAAAAQHGRSGLTPAALLDENRFSRAAAASGPPASPAEKLIDLMLSPGASGGHTRRRTHHHDHHQQHTQQQQQQLTPPRLSAAFGPGSSTAAHAPLSPNLQVIDLMMHPDAAAAGGSDATADGSSNANAAAARVMQEQQAQAVQEEAASGANEDTASDVSDRGSESDDEMDLSELQALVGEGVGPDTPLSVILGMLTGTPQLAGLTPAVGAAKQQHGGNDDIGPRVLFADD